MAASCDTPRERNVLSRHEEVAMSVTTMFSEQWELDELTCRKPQFQKAFAGGHWGQEASNWTKLADAFWWPWCRTSRWEEISKTIHQPSDENGDNQQHLGNTGNWSCRSSMTDLGEAKVSKIWGDIAEVCCGRDATLICVMIYRGSDLNMIHWKCISLFTHSFFGWFIACNYLRSCLVVIACYCWMYLFSFRYPCPAPKKKGYVPQWIEGERVSSDAPWFHPCQGPMTMVG